MKKYLLLLVAVLSISICFSQIKNPVKWNFSSKKISESSYEVHLTATIEAGWHIYSQTTPDGGPIPTSISFTKNPLLIFEGSVIEVGKLEKHYEKLFGVDVKQFSNKVSFVQNIKVKGNAKTALNGTIEFMSCNDQECLPPKTQNFSIQLQ